jgi:hypothetical protein
MEGRKEAPVKAAHLSLVRPPAPASTPPPEAADLALVGTLFGLNLIPVVGEFVHPGRWSPAVVGFAAAAAILTGRELGEQLRARARGRSDR